MAWNYMYIETIEFPNRNDCRNGKYYAYKSSTYDKLLDKYAALELDAFDEWDWIMDTRDKMLCSSDGEIVFVPLPEVATAIDNYYNMIEEDW